MNPLEELLSIIYKEKNLKEFISLEHDDNSITVYLNGKRPKELENRLRYLQGMIISQVVSSKESNFSPVFGQLYTAKEDFFEKTVNGEKFILQKGLKWYHAEPDEIEYYSVEQTINNPIEQLSLIKHFSSFAEIKLKYLNDILNTIEGIDESKTSINKLKVKLSVGDLSLIFRLLLEEGKIDVNNHAELYRFIASSFSTVSAKDVSDKSIKNKFLSPDNTAIKNLDILLVNLRQQLKKIK